MTCHDARERLSDLLDDALEPSPRARLEAHLAECAECRGELDRLRATVGLLQRVEPPRAPAGFVDRVVDRAYPRPWHRRLAGWLFLPLSVKLPAEAAALVLVAGLAGYLWQRTPELRDAARMDPPAPASAPSAPAEPPAPAPPPAPAQRSAPPQPAAPPPSSVRQRAPAPSPPAPPAPSSAPGETREAAPAPLAAPAPPVAAEAESRRKDETAPGRLSSVPRSAPTAAAARVPASVLGRLAVTDRMEADRSLADLISRVGGSETRRYRDGASTVVDVWIPQTRYDEFVRGLEALGSWSAEGEPTALPLDPPRIAVTIRIQ